MNCKRFPAICLWATVLLFSADLLAQDMEFSEEETEEGAAGTEGGTAAEGGAAVGTEGASTLEELAGAGEEEEEEEFKPEESIGKPMQKIEIYALQRIWAKKAGRFELFPSFGTSMADPYVRHLSFALAGNYYITEVLGVGIYGSYYGNTAKGRSMNTQRALNFHVSRSFGLVIPINEYAGSINVNFTYVFLYGKFAFFRKFIFNWDAYLAGGVGAIWTRPIPVVDVEYRTFDYKPKIDINLGVGLRIFVTRSLALATELRVYGFGEKLENRDTRILDIPEERAKPKNWLEDGMTVTFNWMWQFGLCMYFPFKVKYKYEK
jgi:outer membrane beta-barrel protein